MLKLGVISVLVLACNGLAVPFGSVPSKSERVQDVCRYYLYTRINAGEPVAVSADLSNLQGSGLNENLVTVVLVHGHRGSAFTSLNPIIINTMLNAEDVNIIVMDWSVYAGLSYSAALTAVPLVAASLSNFTDTLQNSGVHSENIHIVGFNIGAHIAGIAARMGDRSFSGRITGLDPSASECGPNSGRLNMKDANYVEVIHTDGTGLLSNGLGDATGHVDFYANGGSNQPGCLTNICSHNRAYELFAASFINPNLIGYRCSSEFQLNNNLCRGMAMRMGTNNLIKIGYGMYRINTDRAFPF